MLDMLRYEQARVVDWTRLDGDRPGFLVTLTSEHHEPERWSSFMIPVEEVQ